MYNLEVTTVTPAVPVDITDDEYTNSEDDE